MALIERREPVTLHAIDAPPDLQQLCISIKLTRPNHPCDPAI
ncbi:hypothetical protein KR52_08445 [Synechococcus sp. KORDI-52]|nr:hypothetical protein [Synechococcus sp. KORDI-52]AII49170.1 hypothetical protein KR52_08445 [Synechococcus sp. KORDI-52]